MNTRKKQELLSLLRLYKRSNGRRLNLDDGDEFGVRWSLFNKSDRIVKKLKFFKSLKQRKKFIDKLLQKDNFNNIEALTP